MPHHHLHSSPETCHWGFFEARLKPVLTVASGDEITVDLSTILVCPISSDLQNGLLLRPLIEVAPENGLRLRSQIMTDKLVALRRDRIRRVIGRIDTETSEQLDRALLVLLGLSR